MTRQNGDAAAAAAAYRKIESTNEASIKLNTRACPCTSWYVYYKLKLADYDVLDVVKERKECVLALKTNKVKREPAEEQ